jgi:hypothetical protein
LLHDRYLVTGNFIYHRQGEKAWLSNQSVAADS